MLILTSKIVLVVSQLFTATIQGWATPILIALDSVDWITVQELIMPLSDVYFIFSKLFIVDVCTLCSEMLNMLLFIVTAIYRFIILLFIVAVIYS